ncbi:MAG: hypothetical protein ACI4HM_08040 [Ruminococcus sp.]
MTGSKMLKVTGILMIIFGSLSLIISLVTMAGIGVLAAAGYSSGLLWASGIFSLLSAIAEFVAGILGVANWSKPAKAMSCIVFGIIIILLSVLSTVVYLVAYPDGFGFSTIISMFAGLVLPVLYLIGAFSNKKKA